MTTEISPFTDIEYAAPQIDSSKDSYQSAKTFQVGYGSSVLRVNRQGIWLGRTTFDEAAAAPTFAVSMDGVMYLQQIQASNITIFGDTTLADWRNSTDKTTIEGGNIYTNTITADKMNVDELSAISANLGTITAGTYLTAGASERIKIQDDNVLWQYLAGGIWRDAGVLQADFANFNELSDGGFGSTAYYGITHQGAYGGIGIMNLEHVQMDAMYAGTIQGGDTVVWGSLNLKGAGIGGTFSRLYKAWAGSNISVSDNSSTNRATISLSISSDVDFNGQDALDIGTCHADQFYGGGSAGVTESHSWVNAEGDTVDITVEGGIVTNFTVTP